MSQIDAADVQRLADLIRGYRVAANLTQEQLAHRAGVSVGALRDLEQGRTSRPRPANLRQLADGLGLDQDRQCELLSALRREPQPGGESDPAAGGEETGRSRLEVLGPLRAWHEGVPLSLGSHRQRSVLGLLALNHGVIVHRDSIIDALWGDQPPATAVAMVQSYVSRMRRVLHAGRQRVCTLETVGAGYRLHAADEFDLLGFAETARLATIARRTGNVAVACGLYEQALGWWKGDPVADLEILRGHPTVRALRQRHAAVVVSYADAACALGDPGRVLPFLRALAAADPLDERVHAHLMIALAAVGQQAAALSVYEQLKGLLDRELGVRPGAELVSAHQRILRQELPTAGPRPRHRELSGNRWTPGRSRQPRCLAAARARPLSRGPMRRLSACR